MERILEKNRQTASEEIANSITHGAGALVSIAGFILLVVFSCHYGKASHIISCTIFGLSLVLLYTASTLYHSFRKPKIKYVFKILDHSFIYVLIAGTYTPFMLIIVRGTLGWIIFSTVWLLTVVGIVFKAFFVNRFKIISTAAYILMGWLVIFAIKPLFLAMPGEGIALLFAGGISYTAGTIFYAWKKLPFNHAIWHLFVLAGSFCHFMAVFFYVIPVKV